MRLMIDMLLTGACALGLGLVGWVLFGRLTRPLPDQPVHLLIPGRGDGGALEQTVRALIWLRGLGLLRCPIVIADVDLTPFGWELAVRLTARWSDVVLWPATRLPEYLEMQDL